MSVNLAPYLRFVRTQGGAGCWGFAGCAVWDILNELATPNCPNMSMNPWLMLHRRRDLWQSQGGFMTPDGHYHQFQIGPEFGFFQSFGNTTEGAEPTIPIERWTGQITTEGCNEAYNYRLKSLPTTVTPINSAKFCELLDANKPIRLGAGEHFVAIIGYDEIKKTFIYVDSADYADRSGFGTLTFADIDNGKAGTIGSIADAKTFEVIPPKPVPTAVIWVSHQANRMNVNLWLSVEGSPLPKRKIWPAWDWPEEDRQDLNFKVPLPREFIWPPSASNRLVLDLYDSGSAAGGGGQIREFKAAFGAHVFDSGQMPISFTPGEHKCLHLPQ